MAKRKIKPNQLSSVVGDILADFSSEVEDDLAKNKRQQAIEARRMLKKTSPKLTGDYSKGWAYRKNGSAYVVYNKTDWQLTHLLEDGHKKVGGGFVEPIKHIEPVADQVMDKFVSEMVRSVRTW